MPVGGLNVEDSNLWVGLGLAAYLKELAVPVLPDVKGDDPRDSTEAPRWTVGDLNPCPYTRELREQVVDVHS